MIHLAALEMMLAASGGREKGGVASIHHRSFGDR